MDTGLTMINFSSWVVGDFSNGWHTQYGHGNVLHQCLRVPFEEILLL